MKLNRKKITRSCMALLMSTSILQAKPVTEILDLMVVYTNDFKNSKYGKDIPSRISYYEEYVNGVFSNSDINAEFRVVHTQHITSKALNTKVSLKTLKNDSEVLELRQQYGADFVVLLGKVDGYCGLGYVPGGDSNTQTLKSNAKNLAFSLVDFNCGATTFAHELGHNLGLGHSVAQNSKGGVFSWARGHGEEGRFITIMAYGSAYNAKRIQYFSNPLLSTCKGSSCGIKNSADSAKNINILASQFSKYMPSVDHIEQSSSSSVSSSSVATSADTWLNTSIYVANDQVIYNNKYYQAKWWSRGDVPGAKANTPWKEIPSIDTSSNSSTSVSSTSVSSTSSSSSTSSAEKWDNKSVYTLKDRVLYNGVRYEAKWWTKGNVPGTEQYGPWKKLP